MAQDKHTLFLICLTANDVCCFHCSCKKGWRNSNLSVDSKCEGSLGERITSINDTMITYVALSFKPEDDLEITVFYWNT